MIWGGRAAGWRGLVLAAWLCGFHPVAGAAEVVPTSVRFETVVLQDREPSITLNLAWSDVSIAKRPVILMLGSIDPQKLPAWSTNLVQEGFMLAAFNAAHPPDPDPRRRAVWLHFDERFAHSYALGGARAITDARRVVDYLAQRADVAADKLGWLGSSSSAIPGLAVVTQGPRLAAFVGFVCTGAYEQWFETWREHGLWRSGTNTLWPETQALLKQHDPIRFATNAAPTAVLMVSGGADKVVDPKTARAFVEAARPAYASDPNRLRLVVYDGFTHNLPSDVVQQYAEHWFRLYLHPTRPPPGTAASATTLDQSVKRSQINAADHRTIVGAVGADGAGVQARSPGRIRVAPDGRGFAHADTGRAFVPWGFNYDRDYKKRLLEDYWESEWDVVAGDFREMKALGAGVVRVHLQLGRFLAGPDQPNTRALQQLRKLLQLAEETGVRLDITGLGCYRKADVPPWLDALSERERWDAQATFWRAVARTCAGSPAVFCYNLMNEPVVPAKPRKPGDWLVGELEQLWYVQAISLDPAGRARADIAKAWVTALTRAIREEDPRGLITVGLLPNSADPVAGSGFEPAKIAPALDFMSVHLYPRRGELDAARETLRTFQVGKPVVVEETFPLQCELEELSGFIKKPGVDVAGWLSFYWGQTPEALAAGSTIAEAVTGAWLRKFRETAPDPAPGTRGAD